MTVPAPSQLDVPLGEAARIWAGAGWSVFPIVPRGKMPYGEGAFCGRTDDHSCGFHCGTRDEAQIGAWWAEHPDSNIGLTGRDAFVVDEDRLGALVEADVRLPKCPYATTGRAGGGRHFFLRAPADWEGLLGDGAKVTYKVPAVEVKGYGKGYVIGAPSVHATGNRYAVALGGHMPEAPAAVIDKLVEVERLAEPGTFIRITGGGYELPKRVMTNDRYKSILRYTAHLWNRGFTVDEMWAQVRQNLAPRFAERLTERELLERFQRATADQEKNLKERRAVAGGATTGPLEDGPLTEFESRPVEWLWQSWLPRGVVTVMDGNPGVAKSTVVADLVSRVTRGAAWPDGQAGPPSLRCMWITTEDDPGRVLRPRIEAAGGDPAMVLFVRSEVVFPDVAAAFQELLVRRAAEPLGLGLVVLDPLFSHISASVRAIADAEMRRGVMNPLQDAADASNTAVLVVRHFNKDETASAVNRGAGSLGGIVGAARALWTVTTDPEDESGDTKAIGVTKLNYSRRPPALRYKVADRVPPGWLTGSVSAIDWLGQSPIDITEIMRETPASRDAQPVLAQLLANGPLQADQIYNQMRARGFGREAVRGAKTRLGIQARKSGMVGGWIWSMPVDEVGESPQPVSTKNLVTRDSDAGATEGAEGAELTEAAPSPAPSAPRAGARVRGGALTDSSDSSKERKERSRSGFAREGPRVAREGDAPVLAPDTATPPTVTCHFPHDHSTAWRRDAAGGWFCSICDPEEAS